MSETYYGPDFTLLQKQDPDIAAVLLSELKRLQTDLQLIASENLTSRAVLATLGSTLSNKYAEGYPGKRYYGGCEEVDKAEEIAINRAKSLIWCRTCQRATAFRSKCQRCGLSSIYQARRHHSGNVLASRWTSHAWIKG
jgi:glycine/serine hydroxymethyltransferase